MCRFSVAGRFSAPILSSCRRPKTCTTTDVAFLIDETATLGASGHHLQATHSHVRLLTGHKPPAASSLTASVVVTFAANTTPAARDFRTEDPRAQCEIMMPGLRPRRSASSTSGVTVAASSIRSRRAELMLRFLRETPVYCSSSPLIAGMPYFSVLGLPYRRILTASNVTRPPAIMPPSTGRKASILSGRSMISITSGRSCDKRKTLAV
jgi:hypothetical protein